MKRIILLFWLWSCVISGYGQKGTLDGYLNDMQAFYHMDGVGWLWENQLHNRLNLDLYPTEWMKISIEGRTRFLQGNTFSGFPGYAEFSGKDAGWIDLTYSHGNSYNEKIGYLFTSKADRLYTEFSAGNFVGTVGRQRINWGQTFVWNPNDIFNTYSYFDVDYPERPGSDAIRLQYYTGMTSNLELAAKIDSANRITAAGYFRFNALGYDFQFIGGILEEEDLVLGAGWSGHIVNTSFRGELSYFHRMDTFTDTTGHILVSAGLDHHFENNLWLRTELLYSGFAKALDIHSFLQLFSTDMNIRNIGFTTWSIFSSISYPVTPLINLSLAGMYYPEWRGFYLGPSIDFSLSDNLSATLIIQEFSAELEDFSGITSRQNTFIGYGRIKWSF
ncbi:MAG: hypothetical protein WD052_14035 [Bacteroidales bacterium]